MLTQTTREDLRGVMLDGVTFPVSGDSAAAEAVRQWVQDRSSSVEIVATPTRLYLPVYGSMTTVEPGDTVWFDPAATTPDAFRVERF